VGNLHRWRNADGPERRPADVYAWAAAVSAGSGLGLHLLGHRPLPRAGRGLPRCEQDRLSAQLQRIRARARRPARSVANRAICSGAHALDEYPANAAACDGSFLRLRIYLAVLVLGWRGQETKM